MRSSFPTRINPVIDMDTHHFTFVSRLRFNFIALLASIVGFTLLSFTPTVLAQENPDHSQSGDECARVIDRKVTPEIQEDGSTKYTITLTIQNNTHTTTDPYTFAHISFLPPTGLNPTFTTPNSAPIPPGGIGTVTTCYSGDPTTLCFTLALHDETLEKCCSTSELCIDIPGGAPFLITNIRVAPSPSLQVALSFPTRVGFRYAIESADSVLGPWRQISCDSGDTGTDPDGLLIGTGREITCVTDRNPDSRQQFFRAREQR